MDRSAFDAPRKLLSVCRMMAQDDNRYFAIFERYALPTVILFLMLKASVEDGWQGTQQPRYERESYLPFVSFRQVDITGAFAFRGRPTGCQDDT